MTKTHLLIIGTKKTLHKRPPPRQVYQPYQNNYYEDYIGDYDEIERFYQEFYGENYFYKYPDFEEDFDY